MYNPNSWNPVWAKISKCLHWTIRQFCFILFNLHDTLLSLWVIFCSLRQALFFLNLSFWKKIDVDERIGIATWRSFVLTVVVFFETSNFENLTPLLDNLFHRVDSVKYNDCCFNFFFSPCPLGSLSAFQFCLNFGPWAFVTRKERRFLEDDLFLWKRGGGIFTFSFLAVDIMTTACSFFILLGHLFWSTLQCLKQVSLLPCQRLTAWNRKASGCWIDVLLMEFP